MHIQKVDQGLLIRTPAKLNLFLEVLGKRPDGYHEIDTVMCPVSLQDELRFEARDSQTVDFSIVQGQQPELQGSTGGASSDASGPMDDGHKKHGQQVTSDSSATNTSVAVDTWVNRSQMQPLSVDDPRGIFLATIAIWSSERFELSNNIWESVEAVVWYCESRYRRPLD